MRGIAYLSAIFTRWSARWIPSSLAIALLLTALIYVLGLTVARRSFLECLNFWAEGFWALLEFGMQMTLILMTGYMVASSPAVSRLLSCLAELPRGPKSTLLLMAAASLGINWIHWGMGTVTSIILVRFLAQKQRNVDYRVLVAVAYFGLGASWHAGLSGSAPLFVATPGHLFQSDIGVVPLAQTILTPFNLLLVATVAVLLILVAPLLHPTSDRDVVRVSEETLAKLAPLTQRTEAALQNPAGGFTRFMDHRYAVNFTFGALGILWLATY
ncbi:MAG: short-chain fatty acid transporter, partial [Acidobacteria bacterium]|nr:short-chain fatty acid transporter [Acidobacteriota bacterium]